MSPIMKTLFTVIMLATLSACAGTGGGASGPDNAQAALTASRWELVRWPGHVIPHGDNGEPVILNFQNEGGESRVSGRSWCNRFTASYALREGGKLTIGRAASTRMACMEPAMQFESAFLEKLEAITSYRISGSTMEVNTADGEVLTFHAREKVSPQAKVKFIYVAPQKVACSAGVMQTTCFRIRERKEDPWQLWYGTIHGFDFKPGTAYRLRILEEQVANPPADASSIKWTLDLVVEQALPE